ncbi:probable carboxylesterase 18 [Andrographis paniculata]|uniref:probable carboxylesterase 18 n=1 Tax=Andrographis paniculata TaxID=175694 RepID=UPI0021E78FA9|nr:probable carboxylesterase 18 [Andrographis paniculata]
MDMDIASNSIPSPPLSLPFLTTLKLLGLELYRYLITHRDGTVNRRLLRLFDLKASLSATRRIGKTDCVSVADVTVDASRNLWFRLFTPTATAAKSLPLIVYYHGGGFTTYGPDSFTFDNLCTHIAANVPAVVVSVNYRLAPEHRFPAQYDDGFDALKFIDSENDAVLPAAADLKSCFLAGDSAGGNIAHHVMVRASQNSREFKELKIQGLVLLQPFFGGEERTESELRMNRAPVLKLEQTDWMWRCFLPEGADRDHPAAHVFRGGDDLKSVEFPRVLVVRGGYDPLLDWQRRYVEWLQSCGKQVEVIEYPMAFHAFYSFPEVPEFKLLIRDVSSFIRKQNHCD